MIQYVIGDATNPLASGQKIIADVCNDIGKWRGRRDHVPVQT